jgi:hypothetical protein
MADRHADKLKDFVSSRTPGGVYSLERLMQVADAEDEYAFAETIADLIHAGIIEQFVRVESPQGSGGLVDYPSIAEVPREVEDWRRGNLLMTVTPENLKILYRFRERGR